MKKLVFSLCFCVFVLVGKAQQIQLFAGMVPNKTGVELKWIGKDLNRDDSYDIYRKTKSSEWVKANSSPIKRATPLDLKQLKDEAEKPDKNNILITYSEAFLKSDDGNDIQGLSYFILYLIAPTQNDLAKLMGIYYVDEVISDGTTYEYCLTKAGKSPQAALANTSIVATAYSQPQAPAGFEAKAKDKVVEFKWGTDKKYSQYRIYRSSVTNKLPDDTMNVLLSEEQIKKATKGEFFFSDKDSLLQNGKTYYYKICGVDFFGHETRLSSEISSTPIDLTPPNMAYGFRSELKDKYVQLRWLKSKDADCNGYNIYKSQNNTTGFVKMNTTLLTKTDTTFTDKNTKDGEQYFYYLEALDKNNNAAKTDVISYVLPDMTPPAVPKNLSAKTDTGKIHLKWDKNTEIDLDGYYIFRALKNENSNFQLLNAEPLHTTFFTDTLYKEAGNYFLYRICAVDKNYNRSAPSAYIATKMPDAVAPRPVILKSAEWEGGKVKLQWLPNHEYDLKGYDVWRAEADTGNKAISPQKISTTLLGAKTITYIDDKASSSKKWQYYILTVDSTGNRSIPSNKITLPAAALAASAADFTVRATYNASAKSVSISWDVAAGAVHGYKVYRKNETGGYVPISAIGNTTSFTDKYAEDGKTYTYKVLAVAMSGNDVYSKEVKVKTK